MKPGSGTIIDIHESGIFSGIFDLKLANLSSW